MKKYTYYLALLTGLVFASCTGKVAKNKVEASAAEVASASVGNQKLVVDTLKSTIGWKGFKPGGSHHGVLALKSGELTLQGTELKTGSFVIDMNKIICQDLTDKAMNDKLVGHLKSADFFDVATYPLATFTITKTEKLKEGANKFRVHGNLQLKKVTKNIVFDMTVSKDKDSFVAKTVTFTIDRTQWGVNYGSKNIFKNLKDSFINDDMEITITIVASPK